MQARGGVAGAEAIELVRRDHDDRGPAADRHALRLTGCRKLDDFAESRPGFPELPAGIDGRGVRRVRWFGQGGCSFCGRFRTPRGRGRFCSMRPATSWNRGELSAESAEESWPQISNDAAEAEEEPTSLGVGLDNCCCLQQ